MKYFLHLTVVVRVNCIRKVNAQPSIYEFQLSTLKANTDIGNRSIAFTAIENFYIVVPFSISCGRCQYCAKTSKSKVRILLIYSHQRKQWLQLKDVLDINPVHSGISPH